MTARNYGIASVERHEAVVAEVDALRAAGGAR
jgi:hypothetical protein